MYFADLFGDLRSPLVANGYELVLRILDVFIKYIIYLTRKYAVNCFMRVGVVFGTYNLFGNNM